MRRALQLQNVYFFLGLAACFGALLVSFETVSTELFEPSQAFAFGLVLIVGGLWRIVGRRLVDWGTVRLSRHEVDAIIAVSTCYLAGRVGTDIADRASDDEALVAMALYLASVLVGFLTLHVRSANSPAELSEHIGRWITMCGGLVGAACTPLVPLALAHLILDASVREMVLPWVLTTSFAGVLTWVVMLFDAPTDSWGPRSTTIARIGGLTASAGLMFATIAGGEGSESWLIASGVLGLMVFDMLRHRQQLGFTEREARALHILVGTVLAALAVIGTVASLGDASTAAFAPIGVATTLALVLATGNYDDRHPWHVSWSVVCTGFWVAAMLPLDLLA